MLSIALTSLTPMDTQDNLLVFEIFAFDTSNQSHFKTPHELLHLLASNNSLWKGTPQIDDNNRQIKDDCIEIGINPIKFDQDSENKDIKSFSIVVKGKYEFLESKRILILKFLNDQKLKTQYIVKDEISKEIAIQIYPYIFRAENSLRAYITKFMTTKIGVKRWTEEAGKVNGNKTAYKNNGKEFATYIDDTLYERNYDELDKYIYGISSGCMTTKDLIEKINELDEENPEEIRKLKEAIKSNYYKFFKESFKDKKFQQNWEDSYKIRNKVAHNKLFTQKDLEEAKKIYQDLIQTIEGAEQELDQLILTPEEVISIQKEVNSIEEVIDNNRALEESINNQRENSFKYSRSKEIQFLEDIYDTDRASPRDMGLKEPLLSSLRFQDEIDKMDKIAGDDTENPLH
ncbi:Swt1 family HEPN domain-containing protein [Pannus brasiliensis CCIBt3594]|uniref:Swt1 family HEPN domain-containing protein n=1 Tax=Pannus brasiliensis CCIBt3594 TaxID=1427578 RepID=A0AAW9QYA5_9CHRO